MGQRFHVTRQQAAEQEARSLKCPAKLYVLFPVCVFLPSSVALITFCFTQEAVSSAHSLSQFVFLFAERAVLTTVLFLLLFVVLI